MMVVTVVAKQEQYYAYSASLWQRCLYKNFMSHLYKSLEGQPDDMFQTFRDSQFLHHRNSANGPTGIHHHFIGSEVTSYEVMWQ